MRRISIWAGLALAVAVLTGCPPTYPKCDNDEHCREKGEVCVQGSCQECATDANCKENFTCQGNTCVPRTPVPPHGWRSSKPCSRPPSSGSSGK